MTEMERALLNVITAETDEEKAAAKSALLKMLRSEPKPPHAPKVDVDVESIIRKFLTEIGVPCHIVGYRYLVCAISLVVEDHTYVEQIVKRLYADVAKLCGTTSSRAERAIRHAIECAWDRCDLEVLNEHFGNTVSPNKGKPTNSEFIARTECIIRERMREGA